MRGRAEMELNKDLQQDSLGDDCDIDIPEAHPKKNKSEPLSLGAGETRLTLESNGHSIELHSTQSQSIKRTCEIGLWLMQNLKGEVKSDDKGAGYLG